MTGLAIVIRAVHLGALTVLLGVFSFLLLVARPAFHKGDPGSWPAFARFDRRLLGLGRWCLLGALILGLLSLWVQLAVVTGRPLFQALTLESLGGMLINTQYGRVWLIRLALIALLGGLLWLWERGRDGRYWGAWRLAGAALAGGLLMAQAWTGHAAAGEGTTLLLQLASDAVHLLAAGTWLGGLPLLAVLLGWARRAHAPTADTIVAEATRRFSALAVVSVMLLIVTGLANAWLLVGTVPALIGTTYGRLLLAKVGLFLPLLGLAGINRLREKPDLLRLVAQEERSKTRAILGHLQRNVLAEVALGCGVFVLVGALGFTPPARHVEPTWPFSFRLSWQATKDLPDVPSRVFMGGAVALVGLLALGYAMPFRRYRGPAIGAGLAGIAYGLWVAGSATAIDAYPATYLRPTVPYQALSIANALRLYREQCLFCHGTGGYGDGPAAAVLRPRPADLTAKHTADHTVGDMFWWLTHGKKGTSMPAFQDRLGAEERWDLINLIRTLAAAEQARRLGLLVTPDPWLVAPDFVYTTMAGQSRALKDLRGQDIVLLVLFSLPDSHARIAQLHDLYARLRGMRVEILGAPLRPGRAMDGQPADPGVGFPIVHDGADEAAMAYTLFRRSFTSEGIQPDPPMPSHLEFLIDRQGYIRARWIAWEGPGWSDAESLVTAIDQLNQEKPRASAPDEHVH